MSSRQSRISFLVDQAELEELRRRALEARLSVAAYIRTTALADFKNPKPQKLKTSDLRFDVSDTSWLDNFDDGQS